MTELPKMSSAPPSKLAWLEGIRILAAVAILLYHAQLYFTDYAYTPQPTGLLDNLQRIEAANARLGATGFAALFPLPLWFGFQFVDVFVLLSGFVTVLGIKDRPLQLKSFYQRRILRILLPFWTVVGLSYPILWAIGHFTQSYVPQPWSIFVAITFPLLYQYDAEFLLPVSGPWWFIPLILSLILVFPLLWLLLNRWGARNLLLVSLGLTLAYRTIAIFYLGGHPTYVSLPTPAGWSPFLSFLAHLATFVCGMVAGKLYLSKGGLSTQFPCRIFVGGILCYALGFYCQFSRIGWIFADLLLPIGLVLCCMVLFQALEQQPQIRQAMIILGSHSYSYFLIHNFVVDRTISLGIGKNLWLYYSMLPIMAVTTLIFSVLADYTTPLIRRIVSAILRDLDYVLTTSSERRRSAWIPKVGEQVRYRGESGWTVLKVKRLLESKKICLCQVSNNHWTHWLSAADLEPESSRFSAGGSGRSTAQSVR